MTNQINRYTNAPTKEAQRKSLKYGWIPCWYIYEISPNFVCSVSPAIGILIIFKALGMIPEKKKTSIGLMPKITKIGVHFLMFLRSIISCKIPVKRKAKPEESKTNELVHKDLLIGK